MRIFAWLAAGFALLGLKSYAEGAADLGLVVGGVPITAGFLATIAMLGSSICFYRALRNALAGIVGAGAAKPSASPSSKTAKPRLTSHIFRPPAEEEFDADAAFERYMQQREAKCGDAPPASTAIAAADPPPRPQFGRRVL